MLKADRYAPQAILRVWIPKPDGRKRPLGIPTVADRVVQQAVLNILGPIFERKFVDASHGFRPGRSTHTALRQIWKQIKGGRTWIVDADIKSYFDTIPHERLVDFVAEEVADGRVLTLVRQFLAAKVLEGVELKDVELGTPQGGVISPLLANIYLHYFDAKMAVEGRVVVRYADDFVILCRTRKEAEQALERTRIILESELRLTVHPEKTRIVHVSEGFEFLGYLIKRGYSLYARPREKSLERFREKVRLLTRRQQPVKLSEMIRRMNQLLRGWGNYYRKAHVRTLFYKLDRWILRRVRAFIAKRWRNQGHVRYPDAALWEHHGLVRCGSSVRSWRTHEATTEESRMWEIHLSGSMRGPWGNPGPTPCARSMLSFAWVEVPPAPHQGNGRQVEARVSTARWNRVEAADNLRSVTKAPSSAGVNRSASRGGEPAR
jgi:group II intron reverse transcriptase/maturase